MVSPSPKVWQGGIFFQKIIFMGDKFYWENQIIPSEKEFHEMYFPVIRTL